MKRIETAGKYLPCLGATLAPLRLRHGRLEMAIRGTIDKQTPAGISGWCFDTSSSKPAQVELHVDSVFVMSVRADSLRQDLAAVAQTPYCGFHLPIAPNLQRVLPDRGLIEVTASGTVLSMPSQATLLVDNPACSSIDTFVEMLSSGYIVSPKAGDLFQPLNRSVRGKRMLDALEQCEEIFFQLTGKRYFICYGTLLGLVRDGGFLPHDDDVDVCFLAEGEGLDQAVVEFFDLVSVLRAHGEKVSIRGGAQFHWEKAGDVLDVFMAWREDDQIYMYNAGGKFASDMIFPLRRAEFEGRNVPVPNAPSALLELIYGSNWHTPDPLFQWRLTGTLGSKMQELRNIQESFSAFHTSP